MKVSKSLVCAGLVVATQWITLGVSQAEATRLTNPNAVYAEIFGRSFRFGVGYDRALNDDLVAGVEYGSTGLQTLGGAETDLHAKLLSGYVNYYFQRDQGSLFAGGGASLVTNTSQVKGLQAAPGNLKFSSSGVVPIASLGYENRGDTGFLFRVAGYAAIDKNVVPWLGLTFGYAF